LTVTRVELGAERVTAKLNEPEFSDAEAEAIDSDGVGGVSSLLIVPVAEAWLRTAPAEGAERIRDRC
jgi:hypothetical protein